MTFDVIQPYFFPLIDRATYKLSIDALFGSGGRVGGCKGDELVWYLAVEVG